MGAGAGFRYWSRGYGLIVAGQAEGGYYYVGDLVSLVEDLDGCGEGLEVGDGGIR